MRLLLVGYYGYGNLGDDLLAQAATRIVSPLAQVTVLTPALRKPQRLVSAIWNNDGLVFGGGSLFQDISGRGLTVLYYVGIALIGLCLRKKLFIIGHGLGPITKSYNRALVRFVLQQAQCVTVRNRESLAFVQALGITHAQLFNDLIFSELPTVKKSPKRKRIKLVFSIRSAVDLQLEQLIKVLQELSAYEVSVVPLQKNADEKIIAGLKKYARVLPYNPQKIMSELASADYIIGMRLHSLVLAACFQIPFIGLAYDPKVEGFCKHMHMPYVAITDMLAVPALLHQELPKRQYYRAQIQDRVAREFVLAVAHMNIVQEAIRYAFR